jgi:uncharacterized membrane protein
MTSPAEPAVIAVAESAPKARSRIVYALLLILAAVTAVFLWYAPAGLLGKADAIGYAVCHRIDVRSFHLGTREMPLCARCTGTFLGAMAGWIVFLLAGRGRSAAWPPAIPAGLLAMSIVPFGLDGLNSYLTFFPFLPHVYEPQNWLRLTTGMFLGLSMTALFLPAVNQSLWKQPSTVPVLRNFREWFAYLCLAPVLIGLVLLENPIVLFPLALLSTAGILFLLTGVYTAVLLMIFRKEATAAGWRDAWPYVVAGLTLTLLQILAIDAVRYAITGTWSGFSIGGFG